MSRLAFIPSAAPYNPGMACLCQLCHERPASTHLTEIGPEGRLREVHLCPTCIQEQGFELTANPPPVEAILQAQEAAGSAEDPPAGSGRRCPACGLAFSDFGNSNIFGCPACYQAFDTEVAQLARRFHGALRHVGRGPGTAHPTTARLPRSQAAERRAQRQELARRLKAAVAAERFEEAMSLRDQLSRLDQDGGGPA